MTTSDATADLIARTAIAELVNGYALAIRRGDPAAAAALFATAGRFEVREADPRDWAAFTVRSRAEGRDAVAAYVTGATAQARMLPMIHNLIVTLDGGGATARASSLMVGRVWPSSTEVSGEYADSFVREDGRWCFSERIYTIYRAAEA